MTSGAGCLDDDALHSMGVAVRESVINAVKHGNGNDSRKRVHVEFTELNEHDGGGGVLIRACDEGPGFDPSTLPDCLAPENLLKCSGRGIFLIRSFMDELVLQRAPEGGMELRMVKRLNTSERNAALLPDPVFLATAVEIVLRAGAIQLERREPVFASPRRARSISSRKSISNANVCAARSSRSGSPNMTSWRKNWGWFVGVQPAVAVGLRPTRWHHELRPRPSDLLRVARARDRWPRWSAPFTTRRATSCLLRSEGTERMSTDGRWRFRRPLD